MEKKEPRKPEFGKGFGLMGAGCVIALFVPIIIGVIFVIATLVFSHL